MSKTLAIKQAKIKEALIEHLKKAPIVEFACQKTNISRATFYRWKKADSTFAEEVDEAIVSGASLVNDMAESKLIAAIKEGNMSGIIYWLKHHHPAYTTRVELAVGLKQNEELTPEQQEVVQKALTLATLTESNFINKDNYDE
jgi:predicted DNA binding protein